MFGGRSSRPDSAAERKPSRWLRRIGAGLLVLALAFSFAAVHPTPARADALQDLKQLQQQQDQLEAQIRALQQQKTNTRAKYNQVQAQIADKQAQLNKLNKQLNSLQSQLQQTVNDVQQATADLQDAQARLDARTNALETRLRTVYEDGNVSYLEVLLSATDFSDFISRVELLEQIISGDSQMIQQVKAEQADVTAKKKALEDKQATIASLVTQANSQAAAISQLTAALKQTKGKLAGNLQQIADQEDDLLAQSNRLTGQIAAIQAKLGVKRVGKLSMMWPVIARITSPFGNRYHPIYHRYIFHTGIDLGASYGTPIKAAESGTVILAGWVSGYGNTTVIDHGDGVSTLYGHQSKLAVHAGDQVTKGQTIGYVGSTGNSTGPHLHFEVRVNGQVQNPLNYLP